LAHDRIFGFDRGGTAGLATAAFYASPVEFQRVGEEGYRALARGEIFHTEAEMRRQDGSPFLAKLIGQAIDPQDPGAGSIWQVEDITEQIAQRRKLLELLRQTEHDARMKGQLLREVNHRVTNNLTSVLGLIVLEQERAPAGDRERVAPSLDRLQQSIRGLLTVHRMLAQSAWAPVNLTHLAREIIRAALNAAPWRNQAVVTIEPSELRVSPRQAGGVALIFNELATNSVKYAHPDSRPVTLSVTFAATPGWITICYRDNGPGYAADVIESQRANMGLKLIQDVVATTLGGTVELENENGAKTTIRMQPEMETRT
jgi:two-component sensor histidine kinase